jgi:hypothetical protein
MAAFTCLNTNNNLGKSRAQTLTVDPAVSGAIAINAGVINGQLNNTNNKLDLIQKGQLAVSGQLVIVNNLQNKIYQGLSQVASVVNNLTTVKEIAQCGVDIIGDVEESVRLAKSDPGIIAFRRAWCQRFSNKGDNARRRSQRLCPPGWD